MNCLTGFVKKEGGREIYYKCTLSHVLTLFSKSLVRACTIAVQAGIDVEMYTNKQTNIHTIIHTIITYKHNLASSRH